MVNFRQRLAAFMNPYGSSMNTLGDSRSGDEYVKTGYNEGFTNSPVANESTESIQQTLHMNPYMTITDRQMTELVGTLSDYGIFKAYIPDFLYKPPYGFPRKTNATLTKLLSKTTYVASIIKTLTDEATTIPWSIIYKPDTKINSKEQREYLDDRISAAMRFFECMNDNNETFAFNLKKTIMGIMQIDGGVWVKVFDMSGKFHSVYVRDGGSFLMNTDINGTLRDRAEYIAPDLGLNIVQTMNINAARHKLGGTGLLEPRADPEKIRDYYNRNFLPVAAYFQYGWTSGSMPIPFGKRELAYFMANPQPDSIYGLSPIETVRDVLFSLVYGARYNTSFYLNNNMPEGVLQMLGATPDHINDFRAKFEKQFIGKDEFFNRVKRFFHIPIVNREIDWKPLQIPSKEMQIVEQQQWFTRILWAAFGVTAEEMGFTDRSNRNVSEQQILLSKRKALAPLLKVIQDVINSSIMPEFFTNGLNENMKKFSDIPIMFTFENYDTEKELSQLQIIKAKMEMGILTPITAGMELGYDESEIKRTRKEYFDEIEATKLDFASGFMSPKHYDPGVPSVGKGENSGRPPNKTKQAASDPARKKTQTYYKGEARGVERRLNES